MNMPVILGLLWLITAVSLALFISKGLKKRSMKVGFIFIAISYLLGVILLIGLLAWV